MFAACVFQCRMSQAFELCLSLVLSQPNPKCLGSSRFLTPVCWQISLSQKKCLDFIIAFQPLLWLLGFQKYCILLAMIVLCTCCKYCSNKTLEKSTATI